MAPGRRSSWTRTSSASSYWSTFLGVWTWGKGGFRIGADKSLSGSHWAIPYIRGVRRTGADGNWLRHLLVDRLCGVRAGDRIDVAGCEDDSFNGKNLLVHAVAELPMANIEATGPTIYAVEEHTKREQA